jgi:hypothetical protein
MTSQRSTPLFFPSPSPSQGVSHRGYFSAPPFLLTPRPELSTQGAIELDDYRQWSDYEQGAGFTPEPMQGGVLLGRVPFSSPLPPSRERVFTEEGSLTEVEPDDSGILTSPPRAQRPNTIRTSPSIIHSTPPIFSRAGTVISWPPTRPSSKASSVSNIGPLRRQRGEIVVGNDDPPPMPRVDTTSSGFRWSSKSYFCTWSQIGDIPNSALEEKVASFGALVKGA